MRRKIYIILILTALLIVLPGCTGKLNASEKEIEDLKIKITRLQDRVDTLNEELSGKDTLTGNLNLLLSTVYFGSAVSEADGHRKNFTAFTMHYRDKYYLITAGHCIKYDNVIYTDFKFKSNEGQWVYPELLYYEADYNNCRDFAIFTSPYLRKGLIIENEDREPAYVLGNIERKLNLFKEFSSSIEGESGSPVLSKNCRLVGIVIKNNSDYTPIEAVTGTIDLILEEEDT
jgi:hypothetical protein